MRKNEKIKREKKILALIAEMQMFSLVIMPQPSWLCILVGGGLEPQENK